MAENIINKLMQEYSSLTKSHKRVADYILAHRVDTQYMTISELAEKCKVAESTLTCFCKALECTGFNEFKLSLAKSSISATNSEEYFGICGAINQQDSISDISQKLYTINKEALQQTLELMDPKKIEAAVDILVASEQVYCFGQGLSSVLAMEAWGRFADVSPKFHCVQDSHLQAMTCALLDERSAILYFSYSGATRELMELAHQIKADNIPLILVSRFPKCPAASFADVLILCGSNEGPLGMGSIAAKIAQLFVVDVLFNEFCRRAPILSQEKRSKSISAITQKLL